MPRLLFQPKSLGDALDVIYLKFTLLILLET